MGQAAVEAGMTVIWFTIEDLGALVRRHRADDSIARAMGRLIRSDLIIIDLCRPGNYAGWCSRAIGNRLIGVGF